MSNAIWLRARPGEIGIAVEVAGQLADYALWRPGAPDGLGDLHRGRVGARAAALGGTFVSLDGEPDGFLPDREIDAPPSVGTLIGVRVVRSPLGGKGPRLTARLCDDDAQAAQGDMRRIRRGPSPLDELVARHAALPIRLRDRAVAAELSPLLGARLVVDDGGCGPALEDQIAALGQTDVALPGGARGSIWPTPALVAIDVDMAAASNARAPRQVAHFAANRALLPALMHQIRLRNLSGAILVDLAGLAARKRVRLGPDIESALAADPLRPRLLGFTALGLAEIVRARRRPALHDMRQGPHAKALDAAAALAAAQAGDPHRPFALGVAPELVRAFEADPGIGRDLARASGRPLIVRPDPSLPAGGWKVEEHKT